MTTSIKVLKLLVQWLGSIFELFCIILNNTLTKLFGGLK